MLEVAGDDEVGDLVPRGPGNLAGIEQLDLVGGVVALNVIPVVVGPHEAELDAAVVRGLQEAAIEGALEVWAVVVVIPIEDEGVDAVVRGGLDLLGHDGGIRFVSVAPKGHLGLLMARETGLGLPDEVPLGETGILGLVPSRVGVLAGVVVRGDGDFRSRGSGTARCHTHQRQRGNPIQAVQSAPCKTRLSNRKGHTGGSDPKRQHAGSKCKTLTRVKAEWTSPDENGMR